MSIWKDRSGLHQQIEGPSRVEALLARLNELEYQRQSFFSRPADEAFEIIRELENLGHTVSVDRFHPGSFELR